MNTKQSIIESYLNLGIENGFDNVSLNDIARAVGIKKASLFSHFNNFDSIKTEAVSFCMQYLSGTDFEINPKSSDAESLFLGLINSFIEVFCEMPGRALLSMVEQKHSYDSAFNSLSEKIDLMIISRFQVAFDFCVQRSWSDTSAPEVLAALFGSYLRKLLVCQNISDDSLSDFADMILESL